MGFYPVCPATDQYVLGAPLFKKVTLRLENGKQVVITAPSNNADARYVQSLKLNGQEHNRNWVSHTDLMKGALLQFTMNGIPNKNKGTTQAAYPYSYSLIEGKK